MQPQNPARTEIQVRSLLPSDNELLFQYLQGLSEESKSRFGPHPFDKETIDTICDQVPADTIRRYVAVDTGRQQIIAYMLVKQGFVAEDASRYYSKSLFFDQSTTCTFAPSVADDWQNSGLGTSMFQQILDDLKTTGIKRIVLWGGVQATNARAVHFYQKHGFIHTGSFWHNEKDNFDMIKEI